MKRHLIRKNALEPRVSNPDAAPVMGTRRTAWRLRSWDDPGLERRFQRENVIAMSDDEIGDLTQWPGTDGVKRRLVALDRFKPGGIGTRVRYLSMFRMEMAVGDIVAVPLSESRVAIGEIAGEYEYRSDEPDSKMRHRRDVRWLRITDRAILDEELRKVVNAPGTICRFGAADAANRLRRFASGEGEAA